MSLALLAIAELAHRAAHRPTGDTRAARFTLIGPHWADPAAGLLERLQWAVFRSLDGLGSAAAPTEAGLRVLASAGVSLPPLAAHLLMLRRESGAPPIETGYVTPWLNLTPPVAPAAKAPAQLDLFPAARRPARAWRRRVA